MSWMTSKLCVKSLKFGGCTIVAFLNGVSDEICYDFGKKVLILDVIKAFNKNKNVIMAYFYV